MKLNCKAGDWALRIQHPPGASIHAGEIVRCMRLRDHTKGTLGETGLIMRFDNVWIVEYRGEQFDKTSARFWGVPDADLRPLFPPVEPMTRLETVDVGGEAAD